MSILVIGTQEQAVIEAMIKYGEENPVNMEEYSKTDHKKNPIGDDENRTLRILDHLITYTIDIQPKDLKYRHISVSTDPRGLENVTVPNPLVVTKLLSAFGFKTKDIVNLAKNPVVESRIPWAICFTEAVNNGREALNILERLDYEPKEDDSTPLTDAAIDSHILISN